MMMDSKHVTLHAACGVVKIIENANNTPKEGSDTKESQTKTEWCYEKDHQK